MRILHTSDWHIGRNFFGYDLHDAQQVFIDHIISVVKDEKVDVLLISGDVYDRPLPSLASIDLMAYALSHLSKLTKVVITSGNHDSARRLGFAKDILESGNVFIRTTVDDITRPVLLPFENDQLAIYGIPYLDPYTTSSLLIKKKGDEKVRAHNHSDVLGAAIARINADRKKVKANKTILMSHAWYARSNSTDLEDDKSESDINIGGLGQAPLNLLDTFDYAALGHLHKPKEIENHIRYSGSALPYSFSEREKGKLTYLIDITKDGVKVKEIASPKYKELVQIKDSMANLLNSAEYKGLESAFVKLTITDERPPINPKMALADRFGFIVDLFTNTVGVREKNYEELKKLTPFQLIDTFLHEVRGFNADPWESKEIQSVLDRIEAGALLSPTEDSDECTHDEVEVDAEVEA